MQRTEGPEGAATTVSKHTQAQWDAQKMAPDSK